MLELFPGNNYRSLEPTFLKVGREFIFLETLRNCYLHQHVTKVTRSRKNKQPTLLDLILTNEENMIDNITHISPLGASDHCCITFDYNSYIDSPTSTTKKLDYHKADYTKIKEKLYGINWEEKLKNKESTDIMWASFKREINTACNGNVPEKKLGLPKKKN